jgi:ElaB/YqjD/DUF883 family membrane-anchored ribosome-binding protein
MQPATWPATITNRCAPHPDIREITMPDATSRTTRLAEAKPAAPDDDLDAQLLAIRAEMAAMADTMSRFFKDKAHVIGVAATAASDEAASHARKARDRLQHGVVQAEGRVQDHPLQSLLMAFGLGLLISLLFRR